MWMTVTRGTGMVLRWNWGTFSVWGKNPGKPSELVMLTKGAGREFAGLGRTLIKEIKGGRPGYRDMTPAA